MWHIAVDGLPAQGVLYGYKLAGPGNRFKPNTVMLDPYAPLVEGRKEFGKRDAIEDFKPTVRSHICRQYQELSHPRLRRLFHCFVLKSSY